jgi:hypothetical protein
MTRRKSNVKRLLIDRVVASSALVVKARQENQQQLSPAVRFHRLPLYPKQEAIIDDLARFTITEATTKAGKTMSHLEWLLQEAATANSGEFWWCATVGDVADIAFRRAKQRLNGYLETGGQLVRVSDPVPFRVNESRRIIRLGGATVWFKSADVPDSMFGEDVRAAVGDEITRWKPAAYQALYTTLTATGGRAKFIGNVKGKRNFAYHLARKAEAGEKGWSYYKLTASDAVAAGIIDDEVVSQAQRDLPPEVFRELYLAEASDDGSNPFGLAAIEACIIPQLSTRPAAATGIDVARKVDWMVEVDLDGDGSLCYFDRYQIPWTQALQKIASRLENSSHPVSIDATGVGDVPTDILQSGVNIQAGNETRTVKLPNLQGFIFTQSSKQRLLEQLAAAIQAGQVRFTEGVLAQELRDFEYEHTRTGVRYSAPPGLHDDCVCALALALEAKRRPVTAPVSLHWS